MATEADISIPRPVYRGRFAPSPTGLLHQGSLLAAVGSFLDAAHAHGSWLLRIEDLDAARCRDEFTTNILMTLEAFGLSSVLTVQYQSARTTLYDAALAKLSASGHLFHCRCTRRELGAARDANDDGEPCCLNDCRTRDVDPANASLRLDLTGFAPHTAQDRSLGAIHFDPNVHRDVIVKRRDGVIAYHLAVVLDDADAAITDIVRGADLLQATAWQLGLQQALAVATPRYLHLPVVTEPDGQKLSKSHRSIAVETRTATIAMSLRGVLKLLRQDDPPATASTPREILEFAAARWNTGRFRGLHSVSAD